MYIEPLRRKSVNEPRIVLDLQSVSSADKLSFAAAYAALYPSVRLYLHLSSRTERTSEQILLRSRVDIASGLRVAVNLAEGKEPADGALGGLYGRAFIYDIKSWFTDENFEDMKALVEGQGDDYLLTEYWSEDEVQAFFK